MVAKQSKQLRLNLIWEKKIMNFFFKYKHKNLFEKYRVILTEWDRNSKESSDNFHKAIRELEKNNIPYRVEWRRNITEIGKVAYFTYSIILDLILLGGIIFALMNIDRWL